MSLVVICLNFVNAAAQTKGEVNPNPKKIFPSTGIETSPALQTLLNNAVGETLNNFAAKKVTPDSVAATLIDLRDPKNLKMANYRGEQKIYPASVVKLFYMAALHRWLENGKIKRASPELERGLKDMIVDSSNEATQYILDVLTDTSSGGELPAKEFAVWSYKRNAVNRYYESLGYERINVIQKTHCEDAYGREQQFRNYKGENRNMLTTNATARLMAEIVLGRIASPERTKRMMDLMKRNPFVESKDPDNQASGFTGKTLIDKKMTDARLWSKAGWTSKSRHDAAYIETPDGLKFVLVIFTENHSAEREPIPTIAGKIIDGLKEIKN
ncbi:MAG: serine hydrolase [Pyrinomonadaceae bacterium]|nr:serine hydrolase [Pyrinomonadaceae bacterium]